MTPPVPAPTPLDLLGLRAAALEGERLNDKLPEVGGSGLTADKMQFVLHAIEHHVALCRAVVAFTGRGVEAEEETFGELVPEHPPTTEELEAAAYRALPRGFVVQVPNAD